MDNSTGVGSEGGVAARAEEDLEEEDIGEDADEEADGGLDKLRVLAGVRDYPMRVKCATLAWHTLKAALDAKGKSTVVTE